MTTASPRQEPSIRVPGLSAGLAVVTLLALVGVAAATLVGGRPQVVGALVGAGLVAGFFLFGGLSVGLVTAYAPRASLLVALLTYTLQVVVLAMVFAGLSSSGVRSVDLSWVAWTVIVGTLGWLAALVATALHADRDPRSRAVSEEPRR